MDSLLREREIACPDAVAVIPEDAGGEWTFRDLGSQVNAFATLLVEQGVRVGDRVAVVLPRSPDLVVAVAGAIRAGAAYVPIDPRYPGERVRHLLEDAAPVAVVVDQRTAQAHGTVLDGDPARVLRIDDPAIRRRLDAGAEAPVPARPLLPADGAVVVFTSGTTGRPKGVLISHGALAGRLMWGARVLGLGAGSVALSKSGVGFVDAVTELFGPLTAGAAVVLVGEEVARDPGGLLEVVARRGVTHLLTVPSFADVLARHADAPGSLGSVRSWVSSGERLGPGTAQAARSAAAQAVLLNFYGSSEVTGDATAAVVTDHPHIAGPVANTSVHVLDPWLCPVPVGVAGEIYIGGSQLADGYIAGAALTAGRFVADPSSSEGRRLYRTGDLARWTTSGHLEYLGRGDNQVKIRGFRIEPHEIRAVLEDHPAVTGAAVTAPEHPAGGHYLAAYVTVDPSTTFADDSTLSEALRRHLADRVPDYMVPTTFTRLEAFPLTPNGKLDHRALPATDLTSGTGGRPPRTPTETALAEIFHAVLQLDEHAQLTVSDDFFHLGGHSLLATRAVAQANSHLGSDLTLRQIFDHPTIESLARIIDQSVSPPRGPAVRIGHRPRPDELPVSFGQQALWLIDQMGGPSGRYVVPVVLRLRGELNVQALGSAVRDVVVRHEALRTLLVQTAGRLAQVVVPADEAADRIILSGEDFTTAQPGDGNSAGVEARITEMAHSDFDLASDLPIRVALLKTGGDGWVLVIAVHHHAVDEWSLPSLLGDLSTAYRARVAGGQPAWPPLPVQYADYALWQRDVLGEADDPDSLMSRHLAYWRAHLAHAPEESTITPDRVRPAAPTFRGEELRFTVDPPVTAKLRQIAEQHGVSMFMIVQAATALTVSALGAGPDVVIGSPVGGRTEAGLENLVGYFVNTLAIRHRFHAADSVSQMLNRTKQTVLEAFEHQAAPFEEVTRALGTERSADRNPLFQIMLVHRHRSENRLSVTFDGLEADFVPPPTTSVKTDIDLYVTDTPDQISGHLVYATEILDRATAEQFSHTWQRALAALTDSTGQRLGDLDLRTAAEHRRTGTRSRGETVDVAPTTLDAMLRARAETRPDQIAVITGDVEMSYGELDSRANALARLLADRGVSVGDRVAVVLPRSMDLVVALTGVIRAGAAYVPVDPGYPAERLQHMLRDAGPREVITDRPTADVLDQVLGQSARRVLLIDHPDLQQRLTVGATAPERVRPLTGADPAVVIFTSGTTGVPKGVVLSHRALANRLAWGTRTLEYSPDSVAVSKSGVGFVDAVTELFGPLTAGATVVLARDDDARDPTALLGLVRRHRVTHLLTVPSFTDVLVRHDDAPRSLNTLRYWLSSGEVLDAGTAQAARAAAPQAVLLNFYGSSEVTGDTTALAVTGHPHLGGPVANTSVHVLDAWLRRAPVGVAGEIYVGGTQLADGYIARAGLTADRFVANPFHAEGERLYRTGDLARWNAQGHLEYLGRTDDQVQIRGFRIELSEIRAALERHPGVSGATVTAREHPTGGQYLVAYVTTTGTPAGTPVIDDTLRAHLAQHLPGYMLPTAIIRLDAFPLTPNGKLDQGALPEPDLTSGTTSGRTPETSTEAALAAVFRTVLHLDAGTRLSVDDDFFRLGGDSISAAEFVTLTRQENLHFTMRDVFERRTIDALAATLTPTSPAPPAEGLLLPNSTVIERLRDAGGDIPAPVFTEGFVLPPHVTSASIASAFASLVAGTEALRLSVDTSSRRLWLTRLLPPEAVRPRTHELPAAGEINADAIRSAAVDLVDVSAGRPAGLAFTRTPERTVTFLAVHAAVADRASVHRLAERLAVFLSGRDAVPPLLPLGPALEAIDRAGENVTTARLSHWKQLCDRSRTNDASAFERGAVSVLRCDRALTDDAVRSSIRAGWRSSGMTPLLGDVVDEEVLLSPENESVRVGAFTATAPVSVDDDEGGATPEFALLRYHNKVARRALRRAPSCAVVVTRAYGPAMGTPAPEGTELLYQGVIRYRIDPDAVTVTFLGLADHVTSALHQALADTLPQNRSRPIHQADGHADTGQAGLPVSGH
ncbi:amino acid adenylation domain-containing protein [Kineosporia corallincola]|uniref:amino acid adenylation domain-containing protein n=1 Tax=Kineosporia corallincola TaxID=2835133 RepID=UPI00355648D6